MASRLGQIISDIDKKKENIVSGVGSRLKLLLGDEIRDEKPTLSLPPIGILKNPETKEEFDFAEMASLGVKKASEDQASNKSGWNKFTDTVKTILMANPLFPTNSFQKQVEKVLQPVLEKVSQQPAVKKTIESVSDFTSNVIPLVQSLGADKTYEEAVNAWEEGGRNPNNSKVQQFLYQLGESGPQTALGVGLSFVPYLGAPLSTLYWTTISAGEQIEKTGKVSSATNIAIDVVLDRMLGNSLESLFKTPAKTLKNTIVKSFGVEGGTEVAQDILKMANDYQMAETEEGRSAVKDEAKNYFTSGQILMTAGVGGIVGAGIAAPTYGMSKITGKPVVEETREEAIQPEISEETTLEPQKAPSEAVSAEKGIIPQEAQLLPREETKEVITETKPTKKYIEVPRGQLPVKTGGEKAVSSLEARMKGIFERQNVKKVEAEAKERNLDISFYEKMSKPEVLNAAAKFVAKTSQAKVLEILEGKAETPKGLLNNAIMLALEEKSLRDKNIDTAIKLASLRSTRYGQELSILTEVAELSPISAMDSIIRARRDVAEKRLKVGEDIRTKKSEKIKEIKREQAKLEMKMSEVEKLLDSIVC
ncbi:MAG: hypothetical protein PHU44_17020 [Syntrophales bacterium]|nr:hypothetical protein [Syntrophales bacterium]